MAPPLPSCATLRWCRQAIAAGPGGKITVDLGGKTDRLHGDPLPVRAHVKLLSDGRYINDGPMMTGLTVDLGPTALLLCEPAIRSVRASRSRSW